MATKGDEARRPDWSLQATSLPFLHSSPSCCSPPSPISMRFLGDVTNAVQIHQTEFPDVQ